MILSNCGKKYTLIFKLWIRTRNYIYIMNYGLTFNFCVSKETKVARYILAVRCFLLTEIIKTVPFIRKTPETLSFPLLELCFNENTVTNRQKHQETQQYLQCLQQSTVYILFYEDLACTCIILLVNIWLLYLCDNQHFFYRFCLLVYWWF